MTAIISTSGRWRWLATVAQVLLVSATGTQQRSSSLTRMSQTVRLQQGILVLHSLANHTIKTVACIDW